MLGLMKHAYGLPWNIDKWYNALLYCTKIQLHFGGNIAQQCRGVLILWGGVNGGAFSVYSYENDCFDVNIFDEFSFEKAIPRGLSS
jgi:hypothetical protein